MCIVFLNCFFSQWRSKPSSAKAIVELPFSPVFVFWIHLPGKKLKPVTIWKTDDIIPWEIIALLFHRRRNFYAYVYFVHFSLGAMLNRHHILCVIHGNYNTQSTSRIHARKFTGMSFVVYFVRAHTCQWFISQSADLILEFSTLHITIRRRKSEKKRALERMEETWRISLKWVHFCNITPNDGIGNLSCRLNHIKIKHIYTHERYTSELLSFVFHRRLRISTNANEQEKKCLHFCTHLLQMKKLLRT